MTEMLPTPALHSRALPPVTFRKRSWLTDIMVMLLFAVMIGAMVVFLGGKSGVNAKTSQKAEAALRTVNEAPENKPSVALIPPKGDVVEDLFLPPEIPAKKMTQEFSNEPYARDLAKTKASETEVLTNSAPLQSLSQEPLSLEEQQKILKMINGE